VSKLVLGIKIRRLQAERGFQHWIAVYRGVLPSPKMRWCTKQMKIVPREEFIGDDKAISYIGIRADEHRDDTYQRSRISPHRFHFKIAAW
jgi:3'-phosphoadenosine 5'-phosphosulfate sulfotransferase (PAPS reductase)/FAD synthetase